MRPFRDVRNSGRGACLSLALFLAIMLTPLPGFGQTGGTLFTVAGSLVNGASVTGTVAINTSAGTASSLNLTVGAPINVTFTQVFAAFDQNGQTYVTLTGIVASGATPPSIVLLLPVSTLIGYGGSSICSTQSPCPGATTSLVSGYFPVTGSPISLQTGRISPATQSSCTYTLSSSSGTVGASASTGSVQVTTQAGCSFTASAPSGSFASLTNGPNYTGASTVTYSVPSNSGSAQSTTLTIAGQPFTINQLNGCVFGITPSSVSFPSNGGTSSINVGASSSTCTFSAVSNNPAFLVVNSPASGSGNSSVSYSVISNPSGASRTGTIAVAGQTFTVVEAGTACSYALAEASQSFTATGGAGTISIQSPAGCPWVAQVSATSPFVTITSAPNGSGNGTVTYSVAANSGTAQRTGSLTITGTSAALPYAVTQSGDSLLNCIASAPAPSQVAIEGRTEVVGDLFLTCAGLTTALTADISLTLNTNVTNSIIGGVTDASLLVNGTATQSVTIAGNNTIDWPSVSLTPASGGTATVRVTGVRTDASLLGAAASLQSTPVIGTVSVNAAVPVPVTNASETLAYAAQTLVFQKLTSTTQGTTTTIPLQYQEASTAAFHAASGSAPATRLRMVLTNVPAGVQVFVPVFPNEGVSKSQLVSADANGLGGTMVAGNAGSSTQIPVISGVATATWAVQSADATLFETHTFPIMLMGSNVNQIQVSASLGPVSTVSVPTTATITAPVPRFRDFSVPQSLVNLRALATAQGSVTNSSDILSGHAKVTSRLISAAVGSNVTFTNQVTNDNQDTTATGVVVGSKVMGGGTITSCQSTVGSCTVSGDEGTVSIGTLAPTQSVIITVSVAEVACPNPVCQVQEEVSTVSDQPNADLNASSASTVFLFAGSTAGVPANLAASGTPQSTLVGTAFASPLQVTVTDAFGTPVAGVTVAFSAPPTGASAALSSLAVVTNASGVASVTATANATAGSYSVAAAVQGLVVSFSLTNSSSSNNGGDLAKSQPATQSSTLPGSPPAGVAVDGNTDGNYFDGSVTATNLDSNAWWQVDLGASNAISSVVVWNRTDCCASRLGDYWVFVSNTPFQNTDTPAILQNRAGTFASHQTTAPNPSTSIAVNTAGRYVRIQLSSPNYLSLAEVQVFSATQFPAARQSSTLPGSPSAGVAIDGNTDGNYFDGSVTATNLDSNAWWEEDLGASTAIGSIAIWNRTDCCGSRLSDYWVFVSNTPFLDSDTPATLQNRAGTFASHQTTAPNPSTTIPVGAQGEYVRVQLSSANYLSLAEVQVRSGTSSPDLALGKTGAQSSTFPGSPPASVAVDGNTDGNFTDGSVTATNLDSNPWWQVDLGASVGVTSIVVWNRTDCCASRLNDYWVFFSSTPFLPTDTPATLQGRAGTFSFHQTTAPNPSTTISTITSLCPLGIACPLAGSSAIALPVGRYIRVQLTNPGYLSLAEVQAFGPGSGLPTRTASESSVFPGSPPASAAIDGNTDGNFADGSVTATNADANAWWQVDLGSTTTINSVTIWNRTDCCGSRLSDYWVFVSNTPFLPTDTPANLQLTPIFASHQTTAPNPSVTIPFGGVSGRYIRVQLTGTNYLSLAEVQVQ